MEGRRGHAKGKGRAGGRRGDRDKGAMRRGSDAARDRGSEGLDRREREAAEAARANKGPVFNHIDEQGRASRRRTGPRGREAAADAKPAAEAAADAAGASSVTAESAGADKEAASSDGHSADEADDEYCFICAERCVYSSVAPCNHRTCHVCSLRLRALYRNRECAYCKVKQDLVIFTKDMHKRYDDYVDRSMYRADTKLGIKFETEQIMNDTVLLLQYNCPDGDCSFVARGWADLKVHVKSVHEKLLCDLCVSHKKIFAHEHVLYDAASLKLHYTHGDVGKNREISGFKGHPECGFCRKSFYDDDELFRHCRERHERCHVCDQILGRQSHQYYENYTQLERHFHRDHYACMEPECLEKKFVVFASEIDLKAHQIKEHPHGLSGRDMRKRRDITDALKLQSGRRTGASAQGHSVSDSEYVSREENALRRQEEYLLSRAQRASFGFGLTDAAPAAPAPRPSSAASSSRNELPPLVNLRSDTPPLRQDSQAGAAGGSRNVTPDVAAKHQAVLAKVRSFVDGDEGKLSQFRNFVSQYRSSDLSASSFVDSAWALLQVSDKEFGVLVRQIVDVLDSDERKNELLRAWNDYRASAGRIFSSSSEISHPSTSQILRAKQQARPVAQTVSVWNKVERAAGGHPSRAASVANSMAALKLAPQSRMRSNNPYEPAWTAGSANSSTSSSRVDLADLPPLPESKPRLTAGLIKRPERHNAWTDGPIETREPKMVQQGSKKKGRNKEVLFRIGL